MAAVIYISAISMHLQTFKQPAIGIPSYYGLWFTGSHTSKCDIFIFKRVHTVQWCQQIWHSCRNINMCHTF